MRRQVAAGVMVAFVGAGVGASAQTTEPRFEVASVKPAMSPFETARTVGASGGGFSVAMPFLGVRAQPGGRLQAVATLQTLILRAYGIREYQLEGGPAWLTTDYFDIAAKAARETATEAEMNEMLKSLLAERFGLRVHVETRQVTVHALTISRPDGRLGSGLTRTGPECVRTLEEQQRTGETPPPSAARPQPMVPVCGQAIMSLNPRTGLATFSMGGQPISALVDRVSSDLGAAVIDQTGLTGLFDGAIEYESTRRSVRVPAAAPGPGSADSPPMPMPAALQQQLGLKLEKGVGPLPITIVDAAVRPSPN